MCNIGSALSHAFSFGSGHAQTALLEAQGEAENAANAASTALTTAIDNMNKASVPAIDDPSALAASRGVMARALAAQGGAWSFGNTPTIAPTVGTKVLLGQ